MPAPSRNRVPSKARLVSTFVSERVVRLRGGRLRGCPIGGLGLSPRALRAHGHVGVTAHQTRWQLGKTSRLVHPLVCWDKRMDRSQHSCHLARRSPVDVDVDTDVDGKTWTCSLVPVKHAVKLPRSSIRRAKRDATPCSVLCRVTSTLLNTIQHLTPGISRRLAWRRTRQRRSQHHEDAVRRGRAVVQTAAIQTNTLEYATSKTTGAPTVISTERQACLHVSQYLRD